MISCTERVSFSRPRCPQVVIADEACHTSPWGLKALLGEVGLPLASRMPRHLETLILSLTPGAHALSPGGPLAS